MPSCSHRATAAQASHSNPCPSEHTVLGDRLVGVLGAGGRMTAHASEVWGHGCLVNAYGAERQAPHFSACEGKETSWEAVGRSPARRMRDITVRLSLW